VSFDLAWLALREPADAAARDPGLLEAAIAHLAGEAAPRVLDLGCGSGATCRAFAGRPRGVRWRLVDNDPVLLAAASRACGAGVEVVRQDLADIERLPLEGVRLVTASALLDLCSRAWIGALASRLAAAEIGVYAALSYDGRLRWEPAAEGDAAVVTAFNRHQRRDKGLGPALGPEGAASLAAELGRRGYRVGTAPSPWRLGPAEAALQRAMIDGVARAAGEVELAAGGWAQARRAASGASTCIVGHLDVLALPAGARTQSKTTSDWSP
jgi:SAM-dependent methyltransferase